MKLIKADQPVAPRNPLGDLIERILSAAKIMHLPVGCTHEFVKVQAHLSLQGNMGKKTIHELALATAYTTPEVDPSGQPGLRDHPHKLTTALGLIVGPLGSAFLKSFGRTQLSAIGAKSVFSKLLLIGLDNRNSWTRQHSLHVQGAFIDRQ